MKVRVATNKKTGRKYLVNYEPLPGRNITVLSYIHGYASSEMDGTVLTVYPGPTHKCRWTSVVLSGWVELTEEIIKEVNWKGIRR